MGWLRRGGGGGGGAELQLAQALLAEGVQILSPSPPQLWSPQTVRWSLVPTPSATLLAPGLVPA